MFKISVLGFSVGRIKQDQFITKTLFMIIFGSFFNSFMKKFFFWLLKPQNILTLSLGKEKQNLTQ